jgi:hypothetical protein
LADGRHEPYTFTAQRFTFAYTRDRWDWITRSWTFTPWPWKALLVRIVAMLTRMSERGSLVREAEVVYGYANANGNDPEPGRPEGGRAVEELHQEPAPCGDDLHADTIQVQHLLIVEATDSVPIGPLAWAIGVRSGSSGAFDAERN